MKQKLCKITAMLLSLGLITAPSTTFAITQPSTKLISYSNNEFAYPSQILLSASPPVIAKTTPITSTAVSSNVAQNTKTFQDIFPDIAFAKAVASKLGKVSTDAVTQT